MDFDVFVCVIWWFLIVVSMVFSVVVVVLIVGFNQTIFPFWGMKSSTRLRLVVKRTVWSRFPDFGANKNCSECTAT